MEASTTRPVRPMNGAERIERRDFATARTIDQTLGVQACYGTYCAAVLLRNKEVPFTVALRVLTRPGQLRKPSPPDMLGPRMYGSVATVAYRHTHT